jgi:hypothetical protein
VTDNAGLEQCGASIQAAHQNRPRLAGQAFSLWPYAEPQNVPEVVSGAVEVRDGEHERPWCDFRQGYCPRSPGIPPSATHCSGVSSQSTLMIFHSFPTLTTCKKSIHSSNVVRLRPLLHSDLG